MCSRRWIIALVAAIGAGSGAGLARRASGQAVTPIAAAARTVDSLRAVVAREREIFAAQVEDSGKPADIVAKMVEGKVRKFLAESSLLEQAFVKDANVKIGQLLTQKKAACTGFKRFEVGEGIDKVESDFAAEVAATVKGRS